MDNQFIIDVDFKQSNYIDTPIITQNDTVTFIVNLLDENEPFDLSDVVTYTLSTLRSDDVSIISTGSKSDDSQVTFKLPRASIAIVGNGTATVQLYSSNGRVSTFKFDIKVVKDPSSYNPSGDEKTLIELVLGEGPQVIEDAKNATEDALNAAEGVTQAIEDTNAVKDATEAVRQATEAVKNETQAVKEQAEQVILDTEEIAEVTEQERLDTKAEREATESVRQSTEDVRDATESVKNTTESERIATQEEREKTQSERESTELVRQSVEELKGETESVKQSAEQATTDAITATGDAVDAAEYANVQGKRAEDAADLVDDILEDGPVIAVNGKTGNVVLGAEDIEGVSDILVEAKEYTDDSHKYGGKFEWRYNSATDSLDLVVIE